jgi:hypothetical protein
MSSHVSQTPSLALTHSKPPVARSTICNATVARAVFQPRKKGPSLNGVFQRKYLSLSGLPANDERVTDIVRLGRNEMPGYSQTLNSQDIQDLLAYLHTL